MDVFDIYAIEGAKRNIKLGDLPGDRRNELKEYVKAKKLNAKDTPNVNSEVTGVTSDRADSEAERTVHEEAERKAREEAERKAREEAERKAREEAERKACEEAERKAREEAERKAREEAERKARE